MAKKKRPYPFLDTVKKMQDEKDLDELQELFISVITMSGLKSDEVAALLFSVMRYVLSQKSNRELLRNKLHIDIDTLGADGVLQVQRALLDAYLIKAEKNEA